MEHGDLGTRRWEGLSAEVWASVSLADELEDAGLDIEGYWHDDEIGVVELRVAWSESDFLLGLDPDEARAIAADLETAAEFAETGGADA